MAKISIEPYDRSRHYNAMWVIDDAQLARHNRAPTISPCTVCVVNVCGFAFTFFSVAQLRVCLDYYDGDHQPSSRLPLYRENWGDHTEAQIWFTRLPQFLLERPKRQKVVAALRRALGEYSKVPEANTGVSPVTKVE